MADEKEEKALFEILDIETPKRHVFIPFIRKTKVDDDGPHEVETNNIEELLSSLNSYSNALAESLTQIKNARAEKSSKFVKAIINDNGILFEYNFITETG